LQVLAFTALVQFGVKGRAGFAVSN